MIVATTLAVFPECPSYGFSSRPDYLVKIVAREGGYEKRDRKWEMPLHYFDGVPMGPRPQADIENILAFWHAMGGTHQEFLFKDYADFKSCGLDDDATEDDQPLEVLGGGEYRLLKRYATGAYETFRVIAKPIGSTIVIANEVGTLQASSLWTIDEDTGVLTIEGGFSGTPTTWGGEFYVPARFDGELRTQIVNKKIMDLQVSVKELRPDE
jgi:uncharacterized protein (TIGR02217 family)